MSSASTNPPTSARRRSDGDDVAWLDSAPLPPEKLSTAGWRLDWASLMLAAMVVRSILRMLVFAAGLLGSAAAECLPSHVSSAAEAGLREGAIGAVRGDRHGRMVAPVLVNGRGPFGFVVDTGANRSVLSQGLADALGLEPVAVGTIHTIQGVTTAPLVEIETLEYRGLQIPSEQLPVMGGGMLAGQHGLLGVDGMVGRRLRLDFIRNCIEIIPSRIARPLVHGWTRLRGELRFGHLVVVQGYMERVRVNVLIDTGSSVSMGNTALRDAVRARVQRTGNVLESPHAYTAGEPIILDTAILAPSLDLNELTVRNLLLYIGDFHVFSLWGMEQEPTVLIGMDVISTARGLAIDFERANVYFQLDRRSMTGSRLRGARTGAATVTR